MKLRLPAAALWPGTEAHATHRVGSQTMGGPAWARSTMCFAAQSLGILGGWVSCLSVATAFEKHGMLEAALSFARQGYEPVAARGGEKKPHVLCQAHALAGRVLGRLGRANDAAVEFEAAVAAINPPASAARFHLLEALALRDFLRAAQPGCGWDVVAIRARFDAVMSLIPATAAEIETLVL